MFHWSIYFHKGEVIAGPEKESIKYDQPDTNSLANLLGLEFQIDDELNSRLEIERKNALRESAWSKLSEEEREALGMKKN